MLQLLFPVVLLSFGLVNNFTPVVTLTEDGGYVTSYCVRPDSTALCNSTCHPLSYYVNNSSHYFTSNTEFVFLPGVFILNGVISISHVDGLSLVGGGTGSHLVQCSHSIAAGITITNSSNIGIHSLAFLKGRCLC